MLKGFSNGGSTLPATRQKMGLPDLRLVVRLWPPRLKPLLSTCEVLAD